jgi:hypothetical protein
MSRQFHNEQGHHYCFWSRAKDEYFRTLFMARMNNALLFYPEYTLSVDLTYMSCRQGYRSFSCIINRTASIN